MRRLDRLHLEFPFAGNANSCSPRRLELASIDEKSIMSSP